MPEVIQVIDTLQQSELKESSLQELKLKPTIRLPASPSYDLAANLSHITANLSTEFAKSTPDCVVVQGDTLSALAGALAAFHQQIPVAHVEAGLRSGQLDQPFPEEGHRRLISSIAALHLAPNAAAVRNLELEGIDLAKIAVVGNPLLDLDEKLHDDVAYPDVIVTLHRREHHRQLESVLSTLLEAARLFPDHAFQFIEHSHPAVRHAARAVKINAPENFRFTGPVSHARFIDTLRHCQLVLTDSGGVQEEAAHWGSTVLVLRDIADRPDGIDNGTARLVGTRGHHILDEITSALEKPRRRSPHSANPTNASEAIGRQLIAFITGKDPHDPLSAGARPFPDAADE